MKITSTIVDLLPGEMATIVGLEITSVTTRMIAMGLIPGKTVKLIRRQAFKGSYYITIDGQPLALRLLEAKAITVLRKQPIS